jgi:FkbM family methyltransferase
MIKTKKCKHGVFSFFQNDMIIGKSLDLYGEYAEYEFMLLDNLIAPNHVVIDIGANIGLHSVWFSKHAFKGEVVAFEPNEHNRVMLAKNLEQNGCKNVTVYSNIVGERKGMSFISSFDPKLPGNYGECSVLDSNPGQLYESREMVNIDSINVQKLDFVKIDVEGYEKQVLNGMKETIKKHRPGMLVEVNNSTTHIEHMWNMLAHQDYLLWWLPVRNYNPYNYFGNRTNIFMQGGIIDVLAMPREKAPIHELDAVMEPVEGYDDTYQKMYARALNKIKG